MTYVLLNTVYDTALVVQSDAMESDIEVFTKVYSEFICCLKVKNILGEKPDVQATFNSIFHNKPFEKCEDVVEKYKAFSSLYTLAQSEKVYDKEKNIVKQLLDVNYVVSSDVSKRMKANDLYSDFGAHMNTSVNDSHAFRRRLAGYFEEFGLVKKRFSDAYYYYGITRKTNDLSNDLSIVELEQKRNLELHAYLHRYEFVKTNEETSVSQRYEQAISDRQNNVCDTC